MNEADPLPQYERIALDIAGRIAAGTIPKGSKISGRSVLSSEYHVSSETIRKAVRLLADMKVVEVREHSGSIVISQDNAKRYYDSLHAQHSYDSLKAELRHLLIESASVNSRLAQLVQTIAETDRRSLPYDENIPVWEETIPKDSDKIGKNIGAMLFWQSTGATVVAIKRGMNLIVSPGPLAELYEGDILVFVGDSGCRERVRLFLGGTQQQNDSI